MASSIATLAKTGLSAHSQSMIPLLFASQDFAVVGGTALYWPARHALIVADLHLEKASFYARQGQMLPPYDSRSTLEKLAELVAQTGARAVFSLGDNYHDGEGEDRLDGESRTLLRGMTRDLDWHWIVGNHDPDIGGRHGGMVCAEWSGDGIALRHVSEPGSALPDISGHYHPKIRLNVRRNHIARPCFAMSERHLILPAFGALTGGLSVFDPVIGEALAGPGEALAAAGDRLARFALPCYGYDAADRQLPLALTG